MAVDTKAIEQKIAELEWMADQTIEEKFKVKLLRILRELKLQLADLKPQLGGKK